MFAIRSCLYCVFTEWCNQCNCERVFLPKMSVFPLSDGLLMFTYCFSRPHCFSFPTVNASLDLYQHLYTLLFFSVIIIVILFPSKYIQKGTSFRSETSALVYASSTVRLEGKNSSEREWCKDLLRISCGVRILFLPYGFFFLTQKMQIVAEDIHNFTPQINHEFKKCCTFDTKPFAF